MEVEYLLVALVLDGKLSGSIDQMTGILSINKRAEGEKRYAAMGKWANQLGAVNTSISTKVGGS